MGAQSFVIKSVATSVEKAYRNEVSEAVYEYGNDSYNGTISTTSLRRITKKFDKPTKTNYKKARDFISSVHNGEKWECNAVDMGVSGYLVTTVKKKNTSSTPAKFEKQYTVSTYKDLKETVVKSFDKKTLADKYASEMALKTGSEYYVSYEYVKVSGNSQLSSFEIETKRYDKKPSLKPMPNRKIEELHEYLLYGWAAC